MRFKCICLDHDDTVVDSTATIHYPCFIKYLSETRPDMEKRYSFEEYVEKNFHPGVVEFFTGEVGMDKEELKREELYWQEYVKDKIPHAYEGLAEILARFRGEGGIIAVASHSFSHYIERDYLTRGLPLPDVIYGWDMPREHRKPSPFALTDLMQRYSLSPEEVLVVDDLKPGYDMARAAGVKIAAAGWAYSVEAVESFMRQNADFYLESTEELGKLLFDV